METKEPEKKMDFYEAYSLLESAKKMTGNEDFSRLQLLVKKCEKIIELGGNVFSAFPERGDDSYYTSNPKGLQEKVNIRLKATSAFLAAIRGF
jgi:hypothetical protein